MDKWFQKRDLGIALGLIAVALMLLLLSGGGVTTQAAGDQYVIYVHDAVYATVVPVDSPQVITVDQGDGRVNQIEVSSQGARMVHSTCHNQDCVLQGVVSPKNYETRPLQTWIICLPHQVSIELQPKEEPQ